MKSPMNERMEAVRSHRGRQRTKKRHPQAATLSPRESMKITGIGVTNTYRMLRSGEMPSIKVGKRFFVPKAALLKWLENAGDRPLTAA